jgi:16S rRNA C967 or C1407 C5-methylase (RsmB/RsmF family)/NOL1/NOP2/fmu family ribosome biogenesis protein
MRRLLGDEFPAFLAGYDQPPSVGLRVHTGKLTPQQFQELAPFALRPVPGVPEGFLLPAEARPGKHPYHTAGLYYLQDPAAMTVTALMNPQPGERILDLAAAPGGKATHISARMQGQGLLVANDIDPHRANVLVKNLERWGTRNAIVTRETPARLAEHFGASFDRVLVDAPCSGEGMFRKSASARDAWRSQLVEDSAQQQDAILAAAARLVRPGGMLVYATCTFASEEDEGTVARFLSQYADFSLFEPPHMAGFSPGRPDWLPPSQRVPHLERAIRLWPHKFPGEGHFIALMRRVGAPSHQRGPAPRESEALPQAQQSLFDQFVESTLHWQPSAAQLTLRGSYLYAMPPGCPDLGDLNVLRWGWWLGEMKKGRFEPSHALAMGLRADDASERLSLRRDDPATDAYLRGQVVRSPGAKGWVLVTVDGFPLGWGKRVQGRLKPHFPNWLRQF